MLCKQKRILAIANSSSFSTFSKMQKKSTKHTFFSLTKSFTYHLSISIARFDNPNIWFQHMTHINIGSTQATMVKIITTMTSYIRRLLLLSRSGSVSGTGRNQIFQLTCSAAQNQSQRSLLTTKDFGSTKHSWFLCLELIVETVSRVVSSSSVRSSFGSGNKNWFLDKCWIFLEEKNSINPSKKVNKRTLTIDLLTLESIPHQRTLPNCPNPRLHCDS